MAEMRMTGIITRQLCAALLAAFWVLPLYAYDPNNRSEYLAKIREAEAYYKEKCAKVAGIRIYRAVRDAEGLLLMKIPPERTDRELSDPNWPGRLLEARPREDGCIVSFLGDEHLGQGPIDEKHRG